MNNQNKDGSTAFSYEPNEESPQGFINALEPNLEENKPLFHDDSSIVNEIEKTMQKLLNLNILESLSDSNLGSSEHTDNKININNNLDSPNSSQKSLSQNESTNESNGKSQETTIVQLTSEQNSFILECSQKIVDRVQHLPDLESLTRHMAQYLNEYTLEFQKTYGKEDQIRQITNDNRILKRAVKILYTKIQNEKKRESPETIGNRNVDQQNIIQMNSNLQALLKQKDNQIQAMQYKIQEMNLLINLMAQKINQEEPSNNSIQNQDFNNFRSEDTF